MKVNAIKCPTCKDTLFSRARHDFHWCSCGEVGVDGGLDYFKVSFKGELPKSLEIEVSASKQELLEDWRSDANQYGIIKENLIKGV